MGAMTNESARELLAEFAEATSSAARVATWAEAFLLEGGEPTWDAVKSVSSVAERLVVLSQKVSELATRYEEVTP